GMASVTEQAELLQHAATLFGVAQTLRSRLGIPFEAADLVVYDHHVARVRGVQGQAVLGSAWLEGEQMGQAEAIHFALSVCSHLATASPQSARRSAKRHKYKSPMRQSFGGLTAREREVAMFIVEGKTNRQIASLLVLSERTIDKHVAQILSKLGFHSRAQVAVWAVENGLGKGA